MIALLDTLSQVLAVVVPIVHLSGLYCAYRAIMYTRTAQGSVAWAVSLVALPYVAVPLYIVFGRRKFVGYTKARRQGDLEINHIARSLAAHEEDFASEIPSEFTGLRAGEALAKMPFTRGNDAELLIDGIATFDSIFAGFERAREYLLVQFYIIHDDEIGKEFQRRLIARAAEGVRVYLLYDEIGCHGLPSAYFEELRAAGVDARSFHTTRGRRNRFQINFRNHRKIVIVDGREAWVGGHNVGDEYLGRSERFGSWRDTHCRFEGPVVQCVQLSFLEDWYWATHEVPELEWTPKSSESGELHILALPSGPADAVETASLFFVHAFNSARKRLWIASPYFVPDDRVVGALQLAAMRGVDVRIMLPEKADHKLVWLSSFSYLHELGDLGVRIFRYQPGFLHQKTMLIDDQAFVVGTANLDNRSLLLNFEITMVILSKEMAREGEAMFEADFARCEESDVAQLENRSHGFHFLVRLARLMAPIQ